MFAQDDLKQYDYELTSANDNTNDIMRLKSQESTFVLKFVRYESMSTPVVYPPPIVPVDFRVGHVFPKSALPTPSITPNQISTDESQKKPSTQLDANARGLLLGDLSFLSRPPPNLSVPPPAPSKVETPSVKEVITTTTAPSLEWDVEKQRSSKTSSTTITTSTRTQFLDAVKNRFTSSSDLQELTERQSLEAALEVPAHRCLLN